MSELESKVPFIPVEPADSTRADKIANQFRTEAFVPVEDIVPLGYRSQALVGELEVERSLVERVKAEGKAGVVHLNESGVPLSPRGEEAAVGDQSQQRFAKMIEDTANTFMDRSH